MDILEKGVSVISNYSIKQHWLIHMVSAALMTMWKSTRQGCSHPRVINHRQPLITYLIINFLFHWYSLMQFCNILAFVNPKRARIHCLAPALCWSVMLVLKGWMSPSGDADGMVLRNTLIWNISAGLCWEAISVHAKPALDNIRPRIDLGRAKNAWEIIVLVSLEDFQIRWQWSPLHVQFVECPLGNIKIMVLENCV